MHLCTHSQNLSFSATAKPGRGAADFYVPTMHQPLRQTWCGTLDLNTIVQQLKIRAKVVCLTRSAEGCLLIAGDNQTEVPAAKVKALDTNGAGDMFAGAFLYGVTQGHSLRQAAWLANHAAGQVVSQYGNRLTQQAMAQIDRKSVV